MRVKLQRPYIRSISSCSYPATKSSWYRSLFPNKFSVPLFHASSRSHPCYHPPPPPPPPPPKPPTHPQKQSKRIPHRRLSFRYNGGKRVDSFKTARTGDSVNESSTESRTAPSSYVGLVKRELQNLPKEKEVVVAYVCSLVDRTERLCVR